MADEAVVPTNEVPQESPQTPPQSAPDRVDVVDKFGNWATIGKDDAAGVVQSGDFHYPTADELQDQKLQQEYGTGAGTAKAAGLAAARAATFGLSDLALAKSGLSSPEALANYQKYNPGVSGLGEVAGIGAGLLAPEAKGLGIAAKLLNPVKGVSELGGAVARGAEGVTGRVAGALASKEASPIVNRLLTQVPATALGSAVEGAAYGLGQSVSEYALGDPDLNGEKVLSNVGLGALYGGTIGGALKFGEIGVPASLDAAKNAVQKTYQTLMGVPGKDAGIIGKLYSEGASFIGDKDAAAIRDAWTDRAKSLANPEEQEKAVAELHQGLQEHVDSLEKASLDVHNRIKPAMIEKELSAMPVEAAMDQAGKVYSMLDRVAADMEARPAIYPASAPATLRELQQDFTSQLEGKSSAEVFSHLDSLKKNISDVTNVFKKDQSFSSQKATDAIRGLYGDINGALSDTKVWGDMAGKYSAYNDAVHNYLDLTGKGGEFNKIFMKPMKSAGRTTYRVDPGKVASFVKRTNTPNGEYQAQVLGEFMDHSRNLVNQIGEAHKSVPTGGFNKAGIEGVLDKNQKYAENVLQQQEFTKKLNQLGAGGHNTQLGELGAGAMAVEGHPHLAAAMEAWNMAKNPALFLRRLAKIESAVTKTTNAIHSATKKIFQIGTKATEPFAGAIGAGLATKHTPEEHQEIHEKVNDLNSDPMRMLERLDASTRDLYHIAPNTSASLQQAGVRATQFLASKLPTQGLPNKPLSAKYIPSGAELSKFSKYYHIIENPTDALKQVKAATITPETMEALQAVYPKMLQEMQSSVVNEMVNWHAKNKNQSLPYRTKMSLSMFLGQDLDNSLDQQAIMGNQVALQAIAGQNSNDQMQAAASSKRRTNQTGLSKLNKSEHLLTPMQATSQRGEV